MALESCLDLMQIQDDKDPGFFVKHGCKFQDALAPLLYEGISYTSVTKKIPVLLEKISLLQHIIRNLNRYRLCASSLLILYDGEQQLLH